MSKKNTAHQSLLLVRKKMKFTLSNLVDETKVLFTNAQYMKSLKFFLLSTFLFFGVILTEAQNGVIEWTPAECLKYAFVHNPAIIKAGNVLASDSVKLLQSKAQLFPSVSASADYNYAWSSALGNNVVSNNSSGLAASATADFMLFNGGIKRMTIQKYLLASKSDSADYYTAKLSLTENILNSYIQSLYYKEYIIVCNEQVALSKEQTSAANSRRELKNITSSGYLQITTEEANSNLNLIKAQNQLSLSLLNLNTLLHLPADSSVAPVTSAEWHNPVPDGFQNFDSVYQAALSNRPEIAAAEMNLKIQELEIKMAKAERIPKVSTRVSTGWNQDVLTTNATGGVNASAGISISIPIYDQRQIATNIALAKISMDDQKMNYETVVYDLKTAISELLLNINAGKAELAAALMQLQLAEESYRSALESFVVGKMAPVDLLAQKTEWTNANYDVLKARYSLILNEILLQLYINPSND